MGSPRPSRAGRASGARSRPALPLLALGALLPLFAGTPACTRSGAGSGEPRWIHLAEGFVPAAQTRGRWEGAPTGASLELEPVEREDGGSAAWVWTELGPDAWTSLGGGRLWSARRAFAAIDRPPDGSEPERLEVAGRELAYRPLPERPLHGFAEIDRDSFVGVGGELFVVPVSGDWPPERARYAVFADRGAPVAGRWRVPLGRYTADGLPVWPGSAETVRADVAPGSVLRFATAAQGLAPPGATPRERELVFRVRLDGEELFEARRAVGPAAAAELHAVALPIERAGTVELRFEVEGPPAAAAFLTPVIGPAEVGRYGARPWAEERSDVLLYLADTFRSDNMELYGGTHGVTPNLDRLARESVAFRRAWAPSPWTLPSQSSMMTGLYPHQHGATRTTEALADGAATLAERLREAGFRTAAVTDATFLSRHFGLDQGFEWFDELHDTIESTHARARALLDADDGRPFFLWIQTYRTHAPYFATDATRERFADTLAIEGDWDALHGALNADPSVWKRGEELPDELMPVADALRRLYLGGVFDLDRAFEGFRADLDERGWFDAGHLLFTSDHGEAFAEHRLIGHAGSWDHDTRIPLFVHGGGLEPAVVDHAASLVDVPRTLADLAGIAPEPRWGGASLLELDRDRPIYTFECDELVDDGLAMIEGPHKVITSEDHLEREHWRVVEAYDLEADPAERRNLHAEGAPWVEELHDELAPEAERMRVQLLDVDRAVLSFEQQEQLRKLGYAED